MHKAWEVFPQITPRKPRMSEGVPEEMKLG
jgi:hypothetical protein